MPNPNLNNKINKPPLRKLPKGIPPKNRGPQPGGNFLIWLLIGSMVLMFLAQKDTVNTTPSKELSYSEFYSILKDNDTTGRIEKLELIESPESILHGTFSDGTE